MFFRMLKKDLKDSKGLNVILLLFMIIVSTMAAAGIMLVFVNSRGVQVSQERCNPADMFIRFYPNADEIVKEPVYISSKIRNLCPDAKIEYQTAIHIPKKNIMFEGKDLDQFRNMTYNFYLSTQPRVMDLSYDEKDRPFYVENSTIAIPLRFAREVGLKKGDTLYITSQMGREYPFRISVLTKDPTQDWTIRFFLSDSDYDLLSSEFPSKIMFGYVQSESGEGMDFVYKLGTYLFEDPALKDRFQSAEPDAHIYSNTALVSLLVSVFLTAAAFFMLLIIIFALRFSIRSAIKKEERELGIMRALGTDTFSFRWLFAAKYIAFAVIGGILGIIIGVPAGKYLMDHFFYNVSYPISAVDLIPPVLAAMSITLLIILFIMLSMRKINKISVMNVIRGEAQTENFSKTGRFKLTKQKHMSVPLFLALSDIFRSFRRYALLVAAFTAGTLLVLTMIDIRDTVVSKDFLQRYYIYSDIDFGLNITDDFFDQLSMGTGNPDVAQKRLNQLFKRNNIPAHVEFANTTLAKMITDKGIVNIALRSGSDPSRQMIKKGGQPPLLENEVLIDKFTAEEHGYEIGDTITIKYDKYSSDRISHAITKDEFVITGFVERFTGINQVEVITSGAFDSAVIDGWDPVCARIDAPRSDHAKVCEQIKELFPENYKDSDSYFQTFLKMYDVMFTFMRNVFAVVTAFVLAFLTVMYQSIFMKDEEPQIAMLKSCGFDDDSVKKWQFWRMMILFGASSVLAVILMPTAVTKLIGLAFRWIVGITEWVFTAGTAMSALWLFLITALIAAAAAVVIKGIEKIAIWRIRNE